MAARHKWKRGKTNSTFPSQWRRDGSELNLYEQSKWTKYKCLICKVVFIHRYGVHPEWDMAMEAEGIPKACVKPKDQTSAERKEYKESTKLRLATEKELAQIDAQKNVLGPAEDLAVALGLIEKAEEE